MLLRMQITDVTSPLCCQAAAANAQGAADLLAGIDELDAAALGAALTQHGVKAPETGNDISKPFAFNLMFKTSIGPKGDLVGYLRPETAQGIFVNFRCARPLSLPIFLACSAAACLLHPGLCLVAAVAKIITFAATCKQPAPSAGCQTQHLAGSIAST